MPKVPPGKKYKKRYSDHDLSAALTAVKDGMAKKKAAGIFNIPIATLHYRSKATVTSIKETVEKKLSDLSTSPEQKDIIANIGTAEVEQITPASEDTKTLPTDLCRVCMKSASENIELIPFDVDLMQQYNTLTNLTVKIMDGLPQHLCQECADTIIEYVNFRKNCTIVEISLQLRFGQKMNPDHESSPAPETSNINENDSELRIKQEIKTEEYAIEDYYEPSDDMDDDMDYNNLEDESHIGRKSSRIKRKKSTFGESVETIKNIKEEPRQASKLETLSCGICNQTAIGEEALNEHLKTHMNDKGCKCNLCSEEFERWPTLLVHRFTHIDMKNNDYYCHLCSKNHKSLLTMEYHYLNTHYEGNQKGLKCKICFNYYGNVKKMRRHKNYHSSKTKIACEFCSKIFSHKHAYNAHLQTHDDKREFKCDTCDNVYKYRSSLLTHIRKHHTESVKCLNCQYWVGEQEDYEAHHIKCLATTLKICVTCGKQVNKTYLKRHMLIHEAEPAYKCKLCPKRFRNESNFRQHMDRHNDMKRYRCTYCDFRCYASNVLTKHRRIHTGEKPYVCRICTKGFTGNHNLKVHMKVHGIDAFVRKEEIR